MLRGIKRASTGRIGKAIMTVVLTLLAISFAIWGIGDIFRGFGLSSVAKVGNTEIGIEQFRTLYTERLQQFGREMGRPVTMDQARMIGFDRQVLGQLVAETALDERVRQMGLNVSNNEVANLIMSDPNFQGPGGFDRARFDSIIRNAGYNESRYVAEQRKLLLRRQIIDTIAGDVVVPKAAVEAVNRFRHEERAIDYLVLDRSQAGTVAQPTQEDLTKFFEERRQLFRAPDYRKAVLVVVTPAEIAKWEGSEVNDADARRIYEERKARYSTPEQRQVQQMMFPNAEEAQAAAAKIAQGTSFEDIAKERGLKETDIDLGTIAKASIIDQAVAEAAFALKENEVSAPVQGRFGTAIVRVLKIVPGTTRTYEQVADEIKRDIAVEQARSQVSGIRDKLEDARAGGESLPEAAEKLKLATRTIEAIDRNGRTPEGVQVRDLPRANELIQAIFNAEVGVENDPLQYENGYIWYDVVGVTPARERNLDEVKDELEVRFTNEEIAKRLREKADAMVEKLKAGTTLKEIAEQEKLTLETDNSVKRGNPTENLSAQTIDAVFRTDKGAPGSAEGVQATQRVVFRVNEIRVPALDMNSEEAKRIVEELKESFANELIAGYSERLNAEVGVSINQSAFNQIVGGGTN